MTEEEQAPASLLAGGGVVTDLPSKVRAFLAVLPRCCEEEKRDGGRVRCDRVAVATYTYTLAENWHGEREVVRKGYCQRHAPQGARMRDGGREIAAMEDALLDPTPQPEG